MSYTNHIYIGGRVKQREQPCKSFGEDFTISFEIRAKYELKWAGRLQTEIKSSQNNYCADLITKCYHSFPK